jgi:hypothetical protein
VLTALTKGGLNAATKSLAVEYAKRGIRVTAVSPGVIKTPMHPVGTHEVLGAFDPVGHMLQRIGLTLWLFGVYLVVENKATTGGTTPLAWVAAMVALLSITLGTIYQKRFGGGIDWQPSMFIQCAAAGIFFALGAMAFETCIVHWTPNSCSRSAGLILVLSIGTIWLLYFLIRRAAVTRVVSLF